MKDRIRLRWIHAQLLNRGVRRQNRNIHVAPSCLDLYFVHHRERTIFSRADYQPPTFPGYLLFQRKRSMPELLAEFPRSLLLAFVPLSQHTDGLFDLFREDSVILALQMERRAECNRCRARMDHRGTAREDAVEAAQPHRNYRQAQPRC